MKTTRSGTNLRHSARIRRAESIRLGIRPSFRPSSRRTSQPRGDDHRSSNGDTSESTHVGRRRQRTQPACDVRPTGSRLQPESPSKGRPVAIGVRHTRPLTHKMLLLRRICLEAVEQRHRRRPNPPSCPFGRCRVPWRLACWTGPWDGLRNWIRSWVLLRQGRNSTSGPFFKFFIDRPAGLSSHLSTEFVCCFA